MSRIRNIIRGLRSDGSMINKWIQDPSSRNISKSDALLIAKRLGLHIKGGAKILRHLEKNTTERKGTEKYIVLKALKQKLRKEIKNSTQILRRFHLDDDIVIEESDTKIDGNAFSDAATNAVRDAIRRTAEESERYREECRQLLRDRRIVSNREQIVLEHVSSSLSTARKHCQVLRSEIKSCECGAALLHKVVTVDTACSAQLSEEEQENDEEKEEDSIDTLKKKLKRAKRRLQRVQTNLASWKTACERSSIGKLERRLQHTEGQIYEWKSACSRAREALRISIEKSKRLTTRLNEMRLHHDDDDDDDCKSKVEESLGLIRLEQNAAIRKLQSDRTEFESNSYEFRESLMNTMIREIKRERDKFQIVHTEMSERVLQSESIADRNRVELVEQMNTLRELESEHIRNLNQEHTARLLDFENKEEKKICTKTHG